MDRSFPILYADDTTLCFRNKNFQSAVAECNSELKKFQEWCNANKLTINLNKTCYMVICNRTIPNMEYGVKMNNISIKCTESHQFLGIIIDNKLKFNLHISYIAKKISKSIGIMFKLSNYLPSSTLLNIYNALVNSHLMYCNMIWGGTNETHLNPLVVLQKKCLRIVNKTSYLSHTHPLFISSNVLKIKEIHKYCQICYIHKNFDHFSALAPSHRYPTRNRSLVPKFQRLALCQRSIYFSGVKNWNDLPLDIKNQETKRFKNNVKKNILDSYA